jgi:hypothetical protein
MFFSDKVAPNINVSIFNAFVFTEKLTISSVIQRSAFASFQGRSLDCLFQRFLNNLEAKGKGFKGFNGLTAFFPVSSLRGLFPNKDFKLSHLMPFLVGNLVRNSTKNILIHELGLSSLQNEKLGKFLSKEDVELLLAINDKDEDGFDITPIIPSIKHVFNLDEVPDVWVKETFSNKRWLERMPGKRWI